MSVAQKITGATVTIKITDSDGVELPADFRAPHGAVKRYPQGALVEVPRARGLQLVGQGRATETLVALRLMKPYRSLNAGEDCAFPPKEAEWMLSKGIAVTREDHEKWVEEQSAAPTTSRISLRSVKHWREAVRLVAKESDVDQLARWLEEGGITPTVQKAITDRLEAIADAAAADDLELEEDED